METASELPPPIVVKKPYVERTAADYLAQADPEIRAGLTETQTTEVLRLLDAALPRQAPKIIDLRFTIDLIIARYFVGVMVGKDRRSKARPHKVGKATRIANWLAAIALLGMLNLGITAGIFLVAYLTKSAAGIDLLPGHFGDR